MKRLLVLSVGLLASAGISGAVAPVQCEKHLPYGDVANIMEDQGVLNVVGSIPGVKEIKEPVKKLGKVVRKSEKIDIDMCKLMQLGREFGQMLACLKADDKTRQGSAKCAAVGCNGTRLACYKPVFGNMKTMVEMLFQDFFLGYKDKNEFVDGLILLLLDVVGQKDAAAGKLFVEQINPILNKILDVINGVENFLQIIPTTTPSTQPSSPVTPVTPKVADTVKR